MVSPRARLGTSECLSRPRPQLEALRRQRRASPLQQHDPDTEEDISEPLRQPFHVLPHADSDGWKLQNHPEVNRCW